MLKKKKKGFNCLTVRQAVTEVLDGVAFHFLAPAIHAVFQVGTGKDCTRALHPCVQQRKLAGGQPCLQVGDAAGLLGQPAGLLLRQVFGQQA